MKTSKALIGVLATVLFATGAGCEPGNPPGGGGSGGEGNSTTSAGGSGAGDGGDIEPGSGGNLGTGGSPGTGGNPGTGGDPGTGGNPSTGSGSGGAPGTGSGGGSEGTGGSGQEMAVPGVEVLLTSGEKVRGQLIADYDHSHWWVGASDEVTVGVFDAAKFADYPDDRCIRFLSSYDIVSITDVALPKGTIVYRDMLREKGMVMAQMPVEGPLFVATGNDGVHLEENGNGDFAWDLVRANANGSHYTGSGHANADYLIWDAPIVLPMEGYVVEVIRDAPDNIPGEFGIQNTNNMVGLHVGGQFYLYLLHMRQNTIPASVKPGAVLPAGTHIGNVGNSGASIEPHLHMTLVYYDEGETKRIWGAPSEWSNLWVSPSASGPATKNDYVVPQAGTWISGNMF